MTIYDILDRLILGQPLRGYELDTAQRLIDDLRRTNALGTRASTHAGEHECVPVPDPAYPYGRARVCETCGRTM